MQKLWVLMDGLVASLKGHLSGERLDALNGKLSDLADKGLPVAIGVLVLSGVTMSVKMDESDWISKGIGAALGAIILGYLSHRFSEGCRTAGNGERSTLSLGVYLDVVIVALSLATLGAALGGLQMMFDGDFSQAAATWSGGFICLIVAWTLATQTDWVFTSIQELARPTTFCPCTRSPCGQCYESPYLCHISW